MTRPRSVTQLAAVLSVVSVLAILLVVLSLIGYFGSAAEDGVATRMSLGAFLLDSPEATLIPAGFGIAAGIAAIGVARCRRWGQILAVGVGVVCLLVGMRLLAPAIAEWDMPGSFAVLSLPPAFVAFGVGAYVLYSARINRPFFGGRHEAPNRRNRS